MSAYHQGPTTLLLKTATRLIAVVNKALLLLLLLLTTTTFTSATTPASAQEQREQQQQEFRNLYTYSFGGLEDLSVSKAVNLLQQNNFVGLAVRGIDNQGTTTNRLANYLKRASNDPNFDVASAFFSHNFDPYGFNDISVEKAIINRLAAGRKRGTFWVFFRDNSKGGGNFCRRNGGKEVKKLFQRIVNYATARNIRVVLYPHYKTCYETIEQTLPIVKQMNHPLVGTSLSLSHERLSKKGINAIEASFAASRNYLFAVILSGHLQQLDFGGDNYSVNRPLDDSPYDLKPFLRIIKENAWYDGPVFFINFRINRPPLSINPQQYLPSSMTEWERLCNEVGLYEPQQLGTNDCLLESFKRCMPEACTDQGNLKNTVSACLNAFPNLSYKCLATAAIDVTRKCYNAPQWASSYVCGRVWSGYRQGKVAQRACRLMKARCKKVPKNACKRSSRRRR